MKNQLTERSVQVTITETEFYTIITNDLGNPTGSIPVNLEFGEDGEFSENTGQLIFLNIETNFKESNGEEIPAHFIRGLMSFMRWQHQAILVSGGANKLEAISAVVSFDYAPTDSLEDDPAKNSI